MDLRRCLILGVFVVLAGGLVQSSWAQAINSNAANVALNAVLGESISVTATPGTVNFTLVPGGQAPGSSPVTVTTNWALKASRTSLSTYAYFTTSTAALTDGATPPHNIPSANVLGSIDGAANQGFTNNSPFAVGSSVTVYTTTITAANASGNHTDTVALTINLAGLTLPPATYTGTMIVQAQAP